MKNIYIKRNYIEFSCYQAWGEFFMKSKVKSIIEFNLNYGQSILIRNENKEHIWFGVTNDIFNTRTIKLVEGLDFNRHDLEELSQCFFFKIEKSKYAENLISFIDSPSYISPLYIAIQTYREKYYALIYAIVSSFTIFKKNIFVFGLWEVGLSPRYIDIFFNNSTSR